jgi:hypothetical protein
MPELDLYPVPLYNPLHPYHWEYDNLPLQNLILRDEIINGQVDYNSGILMDAAGTQGTLANRLAQSIDPNGSLLLAAVDSVMHNIAAHIDGTANLSPTEISSLATLGYVVSNPVPYVRMLNAERAKLSLIADEATNMTIQVQTPSVTVLYTQGPITFVPSETVTWFVSGNQIQANLGFPIEAAHRHYYDQEPVTSDYQNYQTTSVSTPCRVGTLRVYINGVRLSETANVYVPSAIISAPWTLNSFTPNEEAGTFQLETPITAADIIRIDFDIALT